MNEEFDPSHDHYLLWSAVQRIKRLHPADVISGDISEAISELMDVLHEIDGCDDRVETVPSQPVMQ